MHDFGYVRRHCLEAIPSALFFDDSVGEDYDVVGQGEVLGYKPEDHPSISILLVLYHEIDMPELVIHNTVVPDFRKSPSGPRRFSTTASSVLPSSALKLSSRTTMSEVAYTARASAYDYRGMLVRDDL